MKLFIAALISTVSISASAGKFNATLDEVFCGEVDPFVVGEACVLSMTKEDGSKVGLVVDIDAYFEEYYDDDLEEGLSVVVDDSSLKNIYSRSVLGVLQNSMSKDYYYLYADPLKLTVVDEIAASNTSMEYLIESSPRTLNINILPDGYSTKPVKLGQLKAGLVSVLGKLTSEKEKDWLEHVYESGEYDHYSKEEKRAIARDPNSYFKTKYLLELEFDMIYGIYKGTKLIGYFVYVNDYVQAEIYQDGAWYEMFLDIDQNVVKYFDHSA